MSLTFNGINSDTYKLHIDGAGTYDAPERDYDTIQIPGKSGDLLIDNGRYKNIKLKYKAGLVSGFFSNSQAVRSWLAVPGYHRLTDTYHPDEYRMAYYDGEVEWDAVANRYGEVDLTFNCQPQRWLTSGEIMSEVATGDTLTNLTGFNALPLVRVYGTGTLNIGNQVITVTTAGNDYIDIDCEIMEAFEGSISRNSNVTLPDEVYIPAGDTTITFTGLTKVEIQPRWWRL